MIDSGVGGGDPVLDFAEGVLDRYGVEGGGSALGAGPATFAESIAGPLFRGMAPDADDILGRMGRMGAVSRWLSYVDDRFGVDGARGVGYRRFLSLDPYYLAMESFDDEVEQWPHWRGGEADGYEDPEAWKYWTLFPQEAPAPTPAPTPAPAQAEGPWVRAGARGRPVSAELRPGLRGLRRSQTPGETADLVGGRSASGAWSVSARHLPALAGGLDVARSRGVGEVFGGGIVSADPSLVHLARTGLTLDGRVRRADAPPELRKAGMGREAAASLTVDPGMVRMGIDGWGAQPEAHALSKAPGAWGATTGPSLLGRSAGWVSDPRPDASLPTLPEAVARMLPRGWRDLVGGDAGQAPLKAPAGPLSPADAARLLRTAPEVSRWFRFMGRQTVRGPGGASGLPGAQALDAAYVAWVESVRHAASWPTSEGPVDRPAADWGGDADEGVIDALPEGLRPAGRVLAQAFPGASGALARRLERYLPSFVEALLKGRDRRQAAWDVGLPAQVADALAEALTPTLRRASGFVPQGMVESDGPTALSDAPYAPVLAALVERAQAQGLLKTGLSGLAPAALLEALSTGPAAQGLPGPVMSLLGDIRSGARAAMSAPRAAAALRTLLSAPGRTPGGEPGGAWTTLGDVPRSLRAELLRAVVATEEPPSSLRAALSAAGLPQDPARAVGLLLRREGPASQAAALLRRHLRAVGLGEWSPAGMAPSAVSPGAPGTDISGRLGGALLGWAPANTGGARNDGTGATALVNQLLDKADWSAHAVGAEGFVPVVEGGRVRWIRSADVDGELTLPRLESSAEDASLWPQTASAPSVAPEREGGLLLPPASRTASAPSVASEREGGLLLPPALRAALGGRSWPPEVLRAVLGMTAGGGKPESIEALIELLSPMGAGRLGRPLTRAGQGVGPVGPAEATAAKARSRLEALADRLGRTLANLTRRPSAGPAGLGGLRIRGAAPGLGELLKRVDSGDKALWNRIVTAMGPAASASALGEELTPALLRTVLQEERELSGEGAGELVGGDRKQARTFRRATEEEAAEARARGERLANRAERVARAQVERVAEERRSRRREEGHGEPLGERTLRLARALFPQSVGRMGHGVRRSAFPGGMPSPGEPDLMLVAPSTEIIRKEAAPLFKEDPQADEVRAGASQAPTQQRGNDPARMEKFLSPEKIEEFARRSFELVLDEMALDAERHGIDPYGFD